MAQLAIRGHATRGSEVIKLLEMLGGKNKISSDGLKWLNGTNVDSYYTIEEENHIHIHLDSRKGDYIEFTLEEFLEKFPYKVGDKVRLDKWPCTIAKMYWNGDSIIYYVKGADFSKGVYATDLQPYKEETMEGKLISNEEMSLKIDTSLMEKRQIVFSVDAPDETELVLGDNFEIKVEDGKTYVVRKKPQYPKTYEECLEILGYNVFHTIPMNHGHQGILMMRFQKLLIFRDAYWKIAGEQMGLGKPWEPDWESGSTTKYVILKVRNNIKCFNAHEYSRILAFPTEEMRDAFYENFKELINETKELL